MEPEGDLQVADNQEQTTQWYSDEYGDVVQKKGWSNPNDALKSYVNLEKDYGGRVKIPTQESTADEVRAFYSKIGVPDNEAGYEITDVPENVPRDAAMEDMMKKVAHTSGIPKAAFETMVKRYYEAIGQQITQAEEAGDRELKEKWGGDYDANAKIVERACTELIPDAELKEQFGSLIKSLGLYNNPVFGQVFLGIGKKILEDTIVKGQQVQDEEGEYVPKYPNSPEMYQHGDDEESIKGRAWHEARGYKY